MPEPAIRLENLTKAYGDTLGVVELDLAVDPGQVYGFLGPNGAGKTTTIRLLLDLIRPTAGSASVLGMDCQEESLEIRQVTGYLPSELSLWNRFTGADLLDHLAELQGLEDRARADELIERLGVELDRPVSELSTGNKRKLGLVQAFMGEPKVLILDEPTAGLDPLVQATFHELLREAADGGACVFLSSHVLSEVETVCDRVAIVREGRLVEEGPLDELAAGNVRILEIVLAEVPEAGFLHDVPGLTHVATDQTRITCRLQGPIDPLLKALSHVEVLDLKSREPPLEEVFRAHYGGGPDAG